MFKLLHIGDVHAGYRQYGYAMRMVDINRAFEHAVNIAIDRKVDVVILPGDLFDTTHPPLEVALFVRDQAKKLRDQGIRLFAIDGNHDMCANNWLHLCNVSGDFATEPLSSGAKMHKMVISRDGQSITLVGIDYMRRSMITDVMNNLVKDGVHADVLVLHQGVYEAAPHIQAADLSAVQIAATAKSMGVKYVALGHYHDFKMFEHDKVVFCYPGSIEKIASNEADGKKVVEVRFVNGCLSSVVHDIPGRPFEFFIVKEEADIHKFRVALDGYKNSPFIYVRYISAIPDVAARLEAAIDGRFMFKLLPDVEIDLGDNLSWTKELAAVSLSDIVSSTYHSSTDENQLIMQMLANPCNVMNITKGYLASKNVEVSI